MNSISIIIPVFNEAKTIGKLLQHLLNVTSKRNISEIIVVDGGSIDGTQKKVEEFVTMSDSDVSELYRDLNLKVLDTKFSRENFTRTDIHLISSDKGRAVQMNHGAAIAKGHILYFLHADSMPPKHFDELIIKEVDKGNQAGCFKMKFDHTHWWLRLAGWLTKFQWRACRGGDQSQFITKFLFNELYGFNENYTIYEDNDLINKLYKRNEFVVIQEWITTSSRRYKTNGIWKLQFHFWAIYVKKLLGATAEELHQYYHKHIV